MRRISCCSTATVMIKFAANGTHGRSQWGAEAVCVESRTHCPQGRSVGGVSDRPADTSLGGT